MAYALQRHNAIMYNSNENDGLPFSRAFIFAMNRRAKENSHAIMYRLGFVLLSILAVLNRSDLKDYQKQNFYL